MGVQIPLLDRVAGAQRIVTPRKLYALAPLVGFYCVGGAVVFLVAMFAIGLPYWYLYIPALLTFGLFVAFILTMAFSGVYLRDDSITIVNPFHVKTVRWDQIERFSLERWLLRAGRVHYRGGDSTIIFGIRMGPVTDHEAHAAIERLNRELESRQGTGPQPPSE